MSHKFFLLLLFPLIAAGCAARAPESPYEEPVAAVLQEEAPIEVLPSTESTEGSAPEQAEEPATESTAALGTPQVQQEPESALAEEPAEIIIGYRDGVFVPAEVRIPAGTTVKFVDVSGLVWPASDVHPTHTICPGFDARQVLQSGQTYSYTFNEPRTCPFHNHISARETGRIIVE